MIFMFVSSLEVTTPESLTETTTDKGKGHMYVAQMELYRTNQTKQDGFAWTSVLLSLSKLFLLLFLESTILLANA